MRFHKKNLLLPIFFILVVALCGCGEEVQPIHEEAARWRTTALAEGVIGGVIIFMLLGIIIYMSRHNRAIMAELKDDNKKNKDLILFIENNPEIVSTLRLVKEIRNSPIYGELLAQGSKEGYRYSLRRKFIQVAEELIAVKGEFENNEIDIDDLNIKLHALTHLSHTIAKNSASLCEKFRHRLHRIAQNRVFEDSETAGIKSKGKELLEDLYVLALDIPSYSEALSNRRVVANAMTAILIVERLYHTLDSKIRHSQPGQLFQNASDMRQKLGNKILKATNREQLSSGPISQLDGFLMLTRSYFGALSGTKNNSALAHSKEPAKFYYYWDALILTSVLPPEYKVEIRKYLNWRYSIAAIGTSREIADIKQVQSNFFNRDDGPGANFMKSVTIDHNKTEAPIPSTPEDIIFVVAPHFYEAFPDTSAEQARQASSHTSSAKHSPERQSSPHKPDIRTIYGMPGVHI